jgi:hypothetical protein
MKLWANELNKATSKEEVQVAKKNMKKCSPSLVIKEMQIKTTLNSTSLLLEWLSLRTQTTANVSEDVGKKESSYIAGGNVS